MKKSLLLLILIVVLVPVLIFSGCSSSATSTTATQSPSITQTPSTTAPVVTTSAAPPSPKSGGKLVFIADQSPAGNIGWPPTTFTMVPQYFLYNSLVTAWWNGTITAELATSWDVDTNAPSITFHLRQGVKFHDGTEFNAAAVKYNFDNMINAKARPDWKSIDVVDNATVRVNLSRWDNSILFSFDGNPIVSPTAAQTNGIPFITGHPVGTGPFKFVSFAQDDRMEVTKNPGYFESGVPYLDNYEVLYVPDYTTRKAAMQNKTGDMMLVELGKESADFKNMPGVNTFVQPQASAFMIFDDGNPQSPFYDIRVRQAVDYAIDRKWIADNLGFGQWQPNYQLPPRTNAANDPTYVGRQFDLAKAKQLLTDAGYPTGFKTSLFPNPVALNRDLWVAVQSQLAQAGINADLQFLDNAKYAQYRNTGTWTNGIVADNIPSYGNMNQVLVQEFAQGSVFYQSMDKSLPDLVSAIKASISPTTYDPKLAQKVCRVLYDNAKVIPISEGGRGYVFQNYVMNGGFGQRNAYFWAWDWTHAWLNK
jgi:peptide/nickel transport system substrate-binding protein